jgi:hypothetical protein
MSIEREKPWNSGQNPNVPASETKPQTFGEWKDSGIISGELTPAMHMILHAAWDAAQAALRAEMPLQLLNAQKVIQQADAAYDELAKKFAGYRANTGRKRAEAEEAAEEAGFEEGWVAAKSGEPPKDGIDGSGALARALEKAVAPVQASLEAQAIETGRILAREQALRERLEIEATKREKAAYNGGREVGFKEGVEAGQESRNN